MNDIKIGFIGCGEHARAAIYPSVRLLNIDIAAVCARHQDRAEETARQFQARKAYDNYDAMLRSEDLDAVFVITSGDQHPKIVEDCLNAGVHVFVEKPLGWNEAEARRVADVESKTGKHVMLGFMNRFAPSYLFAKQIMDNVETFGDVYSCTGMFSIRNFASDEEGYLRYAAIHQLDLIRFLFGEVNELVGYKRNTEDNVNHVFSFVTEGGKIGNMVFGGVPSWDQHYEQLIVTGSLGYVKVFNREKVFYHSHTDSTMQEPGWQALDEKSRLLSSVQTPSSGSDQRLYLLGYVGEVEHFINRIKSGKKPAPSAEDNVKTVELCDRLLTTLKDINI